MLQEFISGSWTNEKNVARRKIYFGVASSPDSINTIRTIQLWNMKTNFIQLEQYNSGI